MNKKVTLNFTFRNYNKVKNSDVDQRLILRLLPFGKQAQTAYQIAPKKWDMKAQQVKRRYWDEHQELVKQINAYKDKFVGVYKLIETGEIHPNSVCSSILHTSLDFDNTKDVDVLAFIEDKHVMFGKSRTTVVKHLNHVKGVIKHYGIHSKKPLKKITTQMLRQESFVLETVDIIRKANLTNKTRAGYMKTLNLISKKALPKEFHDPFKPYYPKDTTSKNRKGADKENLFDGIEKIKTYRDLEAYLLWLYAYCLQGFDAADITNIDESKLLNYNGGHITHYHPFGDLIGTRVRDKENPLVKRVERKNHLGKELYLTGVRSKSAGEVDCMYNMFPILFIRDWLHYLIGITSPELVYKGKDRLRLFNITTVDKKGNKHHENYQKLKKWYDVRSKKMRIMFGASHQFSRHTYTQTGKKRFGYSEGQMKYQLNHSVKGASNTYQRGEDALEIRNFRHYQLISNFEVPQMLYQLYKRSVWLYKNGKLIWDKRIVAAPSYHDEQGEYHKSKYPSPYKTVNNEMLIGSVLVQYTYSDDWSSELQKEYDNLMLEIKLNPIRIINDDGTSRREFITAEHPKYPERLIALDKLRERAFAHFPLVINEKGGIALKPQIEKQHLQEFANISKAKEIVEKG